MTSCCGNVIWPADQLCSCIGGRSGWQQDKEGRGQLCTYP
jgi:hypothetical protein